MPDGTPARRPAAGTGSRSRSLTSTGSMARAARRRVSGSATRSSPGRAASRSSPEVRRATRSSYSSRRCRKPGCRRPREREQGSRSGSSPRTTRGVGRRADGTAAAGIRPRFAGVLAALAGRHRPAPALPTSRQHRLARRCRPPHRARSSSSASAAARRASSMTSRSARRAAGMATAPDCCGRRGIDRQTAGGADAVRVVTAHADEEKSGMLSRLLARNWPNSGGCAKSSLRARPGPAGQVGGAGFSGLPRPRPAGL